MIRSSHRHCIDNDNEHLVHRIVHIWEGSGRFLLSLWYYMSINVVFFCSLCNITCLWIWCFSALSVVLNVYKCGPFMLTLWCYLSMDKIIVCPICDITCLWIWSFSALSVILLVYEYDNCLLYLWYYLSMSVVLFCSLRYYLPMNYVQLN